MRAIDLPYAPTLSPMPAREPHEWKSSLDNIVTPGEIRADLLPGEIRAGRLTGGGVIATVQLGLSEVRHESAHLRNLPGDDVIVLVVKGGSGVIAQSRRTFSFSPGDITFRRASVPSMARIDEPANLVMLRLPITRFIGHAMSRFDAFAPACARMESGIVRTVHQFVDTVLPELPSHNTATITAAEHGLVSLLAAAYFESIGTPYALLEKADMYSQRWSQLQTFLMANLSDPELDVDTCARALGISKRYIHKMFEANGMRYSKFILQHRLERCRDELINPRYTTLSIEQVAFRNGFNDPAHFSRTFRAMFGMSPTMWRKPRASKS